jgi:group I intron endonuclease
LESLAGIYAITNAINGKRYIGSSKDIKQRFADHKKDLNNNIHHNRKLQEDWNKYGETYFSFDLLYPMPIEILSKTPPHFSDKLLLEAEGEVVDKADNLYNIRHPLGEHAEETKELMKHEHRKHNITPGVTYSEDRINNLRNNMLGENNPNYGGKYKNHLGKHHSSEAKAKMSAKLKGRTYTEEQNKSRSEAMKKVWEQRRKNKNG